MKTVQIPRGDTEHENAVTGPPGQLRYDTTRKELRLHDGLTQGGIRVPNFAAIEGLIRSGVGGTSGVLQLYSTEEELKAAVPALNVMAVLTQDGREDCFVWATGDGDPGDLESTVDGHWKRVDNAAGIIISFWRAGLINLQINGTEPAANQNITVWLQGGAVMMYDGTDYIPATPVLFGRLLASVGGYYTGTVSMPDRLAAQNFEVASLDVLTESGWYKTAAAATGAPVAGVHSVEHRELTSALAIQTFYPQGSLTADSYIRYRTAATPTWGSWVFSPGVAGGALAANIVIDQFTTDANFLGSTGFYAMSSTCTNIPVAGQASYIYQIRLSNANIQQLAVVNGVVWTRRKAGAAWGAWALPSVLDGHTHDDRYYTEAEVTTLLAGKAALSHTHDDRYYTEAEVNSLISGRMPASGPAYMGIGDVILATDTWIVGATSPGNVITFIPSIQAAYGCYGNWRIQPGGATSGGGGYSLICRRIS